MRALEEMCELLEQQLKEISKKGDAISPQELDNAYKATDIIKDIYTIKAMKKAEDTGMFEDYSRDYSNESMRMPYPHFHPMAYDSYDSYDGSYDMSSARRGRDGDGDGRYSEDYSGRRGRDMRTGRYVSRNEGSYNYSGHDEAKTKEELKRQIQEMQTKLNNM